MKNLFKLLAVILILFVCTISEAQNVGITDKTGGITPATTLQVHKSNDGNVLQLTNDNTGTTSTDGMVINRQPGAFGIVNQENDTINLGGSANPGSHLSIEPDGTLVMKGQSTVFNDLMVFPDATSKGGSNSPVWTLFKNDGASSNPSQGVFLWMFSATSEQEIYFSVQIPHSYKVGTSLYPHVHWTTSTGTPSGSNVVWGLEYTVMKIGGNFGNTTSISSNTVIPPIGTPTGTTQHLITAFSAIPGNGIEISTILVCRLYRAATDSRDTFGNAVGLLGFDIHYESDTQGSHTEYTK